MLTGPEYCKGYCPVMTSVPVVACGRPGNCKNHLGALLLQGLQDALARDSDFQRKRICFPCHQCTQIEAELKVGLGGRGGPVSPALQQGVQGRREQHPGGAVQRRRAAPSTCSPAPVCLVQSATCLKALRTPAQLPGSLVTQRPTCALLPHPVASLFGRQPKTSSRAGALSFLKGPQL